MDYQQTLNYLYKQLPMFQRIGAPAYKHNLDKTIKLDKYFSSPHKKFKSVHIAGTNGKGSVAHSVASILQQAGYKTGLYTSPHYIDFRERIKINGKLIDKNYITDFVNKHKSFFDSLKPSFFEITVALAFKYFADNNIDIAVIEVGMGGRLDSTNIITPLTSVITNIGYDHMQFLGNTLTQIANEKAGIIKPHIPVILGEMSAQVRNIFLEKATKLDSPVYLANHLFAVNNSYLTSDGKLAFSLYKNGNLYRKNLKFGLAGKYQTKNLPVIFQTIEVIKKYPYFNINDQHIAKGLENVVQNTGIMGRWHKIADKPLIICDAAHNQDGIKAVTEQIKNMKYKNLHIIFGSVADKDHNSIFRLLPQKAKYYFARSSVERSADPVTLKQTANLFSLNGETFDSVAQAIEQALKNADLNDFIFICGSTFIVADALEFFKKKPFFL